MEQFRGKIFGIGFQKTGTSSLGKAFSMFGYSLNQTDYEMMDKLMDGEKEQIKSRVMEFDAFEDNPWPVLYQDLDAWFPGSKFILTVRDEDTWLKSIIKHYGKKTFKFEKWLYGVDYPLGNEEAYLKRYTDHNAEVINYFKDRPEDLLVMDWEKGDGWDKLCPFLGVEIPGEPIPHLNRNKTLKDRIKKKYRGGIIRVKKLRNRFS